VHSGDRAGYFLPETWKHALASIAERLNKPTSRVAVMSRLETGTLAGILTALTESFGSKRLVLYEPFHYGPLRRAHAALLGQGTIPYYRLDACRHIVSFSADFLESWISNVQFASDFAEMHRLNKGTIGRFDYIGPRFSMTAANADRYVPVEPGREKDVAMALLRIMHEENLVRAGRDMIAPLVRNVDVRAVAGPSFPEEDLRSMARRFAAGSSVALAGPVGAVGPEAEHLAMTAALLNYAAGSMGTTIDFSRPHALSKTADEGQLDAFLKELTNDDVLLIHKSNPVYTRPGSEEHLAKAGMIIYLGTMMDETAGIADWVLPVHDDLESWGDYEPYAGIQSLMQPTMQPLADSLPAGDVLIKLASAAGKVLAGSPGDSITSTTYDWLQDQWTRSGFSKAAWEESLRRGGSWAGFVPATGSGPGVEPPPAGAGGSLKQRDLPGLLNRADPAVPGASKRIPPPAGLAPDAHERLPRNVRGAGGFQVAGLRAAGLQVPSATPAAALEDDQAHLWLWSSIMLFDGRVANRGWLQEAPEPVSTITWGSWIDLHPEKARRLNIEPGDVIELSARGNRSIQAPVRITEEVTAEAAALCFGQGHSLLGEVAVNVGANAFKLLSPGYDGEGLFGRVTIRKTGRRESPAFATKGTLQHGRELLQWRTLDQARTMKPGPLVLPLPEGYTRERDLYKPHNHRNHRWAMSIDLQRCIGCGACAVACYAENNIAVVGRKEVLKERHIPWLRIVPYRHRDNDPLRIGWLPMLCQHCDAAPCEPVCPVFASVHNEEGLNAQIYNRCIGTRYCSNNCPYKVRRFNWLNYHWKEPLDRQLNPEVTVRVRGVMEKCTFCVQRIRNAEYRARRENRKLRDGEIMPACAQSCPAKVFTFGDLMDPESAVSKITRNDPRRYHVLEELNTKPGITYLYRISQEEKTE
jgi:molybdopterin-containing oxidoreductase family iron-sulfur binding subunit